MNAASTHRCRHCGGPLTDPFYRLDDRPVCEGCKQAHEHTTHSPSPPVLALSIGVGVLLSVVLGAVFAWGLREYGGLFGLFSIVMGLAIGGAMRKTLANRVTSLIRWSGTTIAGLSILWGNAFFAIFYPTAYNWQAQATTWSGQILERVVGAWGLFDWIFLAIAAWEAWMVLQPSFFTRVEGPYPLSSLDTVEPSK